MKQLWLWCCPLERENDVGGYPAPPPPSVNASSTFAADTTDLHAKSGHLRLEVLESTVLPVRTSVVITPLGLEGCQRKDGDTYIGSDKDSADFVVEADGAVLDKRHCVVTCRKGTYMLKDLGSTSGTFIRVHRTFQLPTKCIISFGDIYIQLEVIDAFLHLRVISGEKKDEEFTFSSSQSPILLGRMSSCTLAFQDARLSRYQSSLVHQVSTGWTLFDGLNTAKPSTNGTWVFVPDYVTLWDGLVFKAGSSLFKASLL